MFVTGFTISLRIFKVVQNFIKHEIFALITNHANISVSYISKQKKLWNAFVWDQIGFEWNLPQISLEIFF